MKKKIIAIMNKKGEYLAEFKTNGNNSLAYTVGVTDEFTNALNMPYEYIEDNEDKLNKLRNFAEMVESELVVIDIDYKVTSLETGEPVEEYEESDNGKGIELGTFIELLNALSE